ncbi:MAG: histidinol-phosphate transaminase [Bacteroidota bacterium]
MKFDLNKLIRDNVKKLTPYSTARDEYSGDKGIFLDANESPFNNQLNRYPDPHQRKLKSEIAGLKNCQPKNILLGNGSDEVIDLLFRAFCVPGKDNCIILPPTYGMYKVAADINDVEVREVNLQNDFQPDISAIKNAINENTKLIFFCSPNNPSGNSIDKSSITAIAENFHGIVVVDEAYIDFSSQESCLSLLNRYPNMVIMQTFSKAWGLAALRLGMLFAPEEIIAVLSKIKPPYNIGLMPQFIALGALEKKQMKEENVKKILEQRQWLSEELKKLKGVEKVFPSDANFLLVKFSDAKKVFDHLISEQIIVRDRSKVKLCEGCLRITVGTEEENKWLVKVLTALV